MLSGKKILISGLLSNRSIAYGIAQSCSNLGAELAFTYQDERFTERISDLSKNLQGKFAVKCNVELEDDITGLPEKLKSNGSLHLATDWSPYAEHMIEVLDKIPSLSNAIAPKVFWENPARPETKFEKRGKKLGNKILDLLYKKSESYSNQSRCS